MAVALFVFLFLISSFVKAQEVVSLEVTVDPTGYVRVEELVALDNYSVVNVVPLLSDKVDALLVLDKNGEPLFYNVNGSTLEIMGSATVANITYYTASITSKSGEVWTVAFSSDVPVKIVLPEGAIIVDLSEIPVEITDEYLVMPPGNISVSYILPPPTETETSTSTSTQTTPQSQSSTSSTTTAGVSESSTTSSKGGSSSLVLIGVLVVLLAVVVGALWYFKGKTGGNENSDDTTSIVQKINREELEKKLDSMNLNDEEKKALLYIYDRGGVARQSDVRNELGIPKTTAWRMFQRLEKQGLVRVYKKGRENWVELTL
ncbi:helix-turn-helix transcriptional regulator [Thermococcus kodakarensis]|uniref:helix-turn-helix transcriptional regulator n=1 Tax=Thermococcus kodakarensis TaxID=311400 RepID=UPI00064EF327|nr:MarR family transcriptional regulator [Thermococcus kodakarensis]WCN29012.1 helix-turn-helix domain-containing protein [Thermococcus kodakarensis]WCN31317.1 helix-turn-helix domain-containing protein [Thermococcus kodakarensis]